MRDYSDFEAEDFAADDYFCAWVLNPTTENETFWNEWISANPWKSNTIDAAKRFVLQIQLTQLEKPFDHELQESWQVINKKTLQQKKTVWNLKALGIAATLSLTLLAATIYLINKRVDSPSDQAGTLQPGSEWLVIENNKSGTQEILLEDGSVLLLEPQSSIKQPASFASESREVILDGEAFFNIKKDSSRPFLIYTEQTMVKVLGTSFNVKAIDGESEVEVTVKTGKVAIYPIGNETDDFSAGFDHTPMIATANQKVIYDVFNNDFKKKLTDTPSLVKPLNKIETRHFDDVSVAEILKVLQEVYGVIIQFEEQQLAQCFITTTLTDETLFEKLDIITEVAGISYYEDKATIIITGRCD